MYLELLSQLKFGIIFDFCPLSPQILWDWSPTQSRWKLYFLMKLAWTFLFWLSRRLIIQKVLFSTKIFEFWFYTINNTFQWSCVSYTEMFRPKQRFSCAVKYIWRMSQKNYGFYGPPNLNSSIDVYEPMYFWQAIQKFTYISKWSYLKSIFKLMKFKMHERLVLSHKSESLDWNSFNRLSKKHKCIRDVVP